MPLTRSSESSFLSASINQDSSSASGQEFLFFLEFLIFKALSILSQMINFSVILMIISGRSCIINANVILDQSRERK